MPSSQALFGIALLTIITARVIEWLLVMRGCSRRSVAFASQAGDAAASQDAATAQERDRLGSVLLVLAWLGALSPPLLIAAGLWVRHFQE